MFCQNRTEQNIFFFGAECFFLTEHLDVMFPRTLWGGKSCRAQLSGMNIIWQSPFSVLVKLSRIYLGIIWNIPLTFPLTMTSANFLSIKRKLWNWGQVFCSKPITTNVQDFLHYHLSCQTYKSVFRILLSNFNLIKGEGTIFKVNKKFSFFPHVSLYFCIYIIINVIIIHILETLVGLSRGHSKGHFHWSIHSPYLQNMTP